MVKKKEDIFEMTDYTASTDMSEEAKRTMAVLNEAMNSVCYTYDTDFRDIEELHETGSGEYLAKSVKFLICDSLYNEKL